MRVIIPMTGNGSRFIKKGYDVLKPFIIVHKKTIIEWIVEEMYLGMDITLILRSDHALKYENILCNILEKNNNVSIVEINVNGWAKKGPVYDVIFGLNSIDYGSEYIINYCDFFAKWDVKRFLLDVKSRSVAGVIPSYTGFHPHLIPINNLYAVSRVDESQNLIEIREKYSFEENKFNSIHSAGTYYFSSGRLLEKYSKMLLSSDQDILGEYYFSLVYNFMLNDGLDVWVPTNITSFCQWGTPEDLEEYLSWINFVKDW